MSAFRAVQSAAHAAARRYAAPRRSRQSRRKPPGSLDRSLARPGCAGHAYPNVAGWWRRSAATWRRDLASQTSSGQATAGHMAMEPTPRWQKGRTDVRALILPQINALVHDKRVTMTRLRQACKAAWKGENSFLTGNNYCGGE